jgi:hypothetical protein
MLALPAFDTDVVARAAVIEGYNSNVYQGQDNPNLPLVMRHPSPFTGIEGSLEYRILGRGTDRTTLLLGGRFNHYTPLESENLSDDGAADALLTTRLTLGPRTIFDLTETASVASFNGAQTTDGTLFAFDPTRLQSTFWVEALSLSVQHELSATWRWSQVAGVTASGTIDSTPMQVPSAGPDSPPAPYLIEHRGLDFVLPYVETTLNHDFTERAEGDLSLLYQYAYQRYVLDFTQHPVRQIGPQKANFVTGLAGYTYKFSPELSMVVRAGGVLTSPPPHDPDRRLLLAPSAAGSLYYARDFFSVVVNASYTWGTVNPRLGMGPTANASLLAIGVPYPVGDWQNLSLIGTIQLSYSSLVTGIDESSKLGIYAGGLEVRYGLGRWLGLTGGYSVRYATFDSDSWEPPFMQHIVFVGVSGFWSTDRTQLPLTNFAPPVTPPT